MTIGFDDLTQEIADQLYDITERHLPNLMSTSGKAREFGRVAAECYLLGKSHWRPGTVSEPTEVKPDPAFRPVLLLKVDELELSIRPNNCLKHLGVVYIGDLVQKTEAEMLSISNFGRKSLKEIKATLAALGLKLDTEVPGWRPENIEDLAKRYEGWWPQLDTVLEITSK